MAITMHHSSIDSLYHHFPDLDPIGWKLLGGGFSSTVFEHRQGNIVVRVARSMAAGRRMMVALSRLEVINSGLPVSIPKPIWRLNPAIDAELPFGAFAYQKLAGCVLSPETVADSTVETLTEVLVALNRMPVPGSEERRLQGPAEFHRIRREQYAAIRGILENRLSKLEFDMIEGWQTHPVPESTRLTMVHGDFWHENILIDRESGQVTGVLDWENLDFGDPAQDLVPLRYLGNDVADRVLRSYLSATGEDCDDFSRRMTWWWENRDFDGIYLAYEMYDEDEVTDGVRKLRDGPILRTDVL